MTEHRIGHEVKNNRMVNSIQTPCPKNLNHENVWLFSRNDEKKSPFTLILKSAPVCETR